MTWPAGISSNGAACGIKADGALDLGLLVADEPAVWAGTFTRNAAAAAPVGWCRERLGSSVRAVVVNSGNANACTGKAGVDAVLDTARAAAAALGCAPEQVLVASTGPIGVPLPVENITGGLHEIATGLAPEPDSFAEAIMTTDTFPKLAHHRGDGWSITGVAKGAAMVAPNMATMLAFIATDAAVDAGTLQEVLGAAVEVSFNRIDIDGCESTNDSVFCLATGRAQMTDAAAFQDALAAVCRDLAEQIVVDAEGGTKVVTVNVFGAPSDDRARAMTASIARSALWAAAMHGADPNWGRVVSAMGAVERDLDLTLVSVAIGEVDVFVAGEPVAGSEVRAAEVMEQDRFAVTCRVGDGNGKASLLTTDLSEDYVRLNAYGTT